MSKNLYLIIQYQQDGKHDAFLLKVNSSHNLKNLLKDPRIITASIHTSQSQAIDLVQQYIEGYRRDGTYIFTDMEK
jgi:hypothetical protein